MAISLRTAGTWVAANATTQTVTLPTHAAGDMLVLRVGFKHATMPTTVTVGTAGWTKLGEKNSAGGASSNGGGGVQIAVFYKEATSAAETNPVITFNGGAVAATPSAALCQVYQKASTEGWVTPVGDGDAFTAATSISSTIDTHVSAMSGDLIDEFHVTNDNTTLTVPTFSQTGMTFAAVVESPATALSSATSNDIAADGCYRIATAGTSSAAAVVTATNSVADEGCSWTTRLRVVQLVTLGLIDASPAIYAPTVIPDQFVTLGLIDASRAIYALLVGAPYAMVVMRDDPISYWRLGEPSGTNANDEVGANDGTYVASPTLGAVGAIAGDADTAVTLDGTSQTITVANSTPFQFDGVKPFTAEAWFNHTPDGTWRRLLGCEDPSTSLGWHFYSEGSSMGFLRGTGGGTADEIGSGFAATAGWHHIVCTYDGSQMRAFYDGVEFPGSPLASSISLGTGGNFRIGQHSGGTGWFNGSVDEVAIYDYALTPAQAMLHNAAGRAYGQAVLGDNPVAYWRLGEAAGTVAIDAIGTSDGAYTNTPILGAAGALSDDVDTAVDFDAAANEYVTAPHVAALESAAFSAEAWVAFDNVSGGTWRGIVAKEGWTANTGWLLFHDGAGNLVFTQGGAAVQLQYGWTPTLGQYYHIVATYDGTNGRLYVDGALVAGPTAMTFTGSGNSVNIAARHANGGTGATDYLDGKIDEVSLYNYALTLAQVSDHWTAGGGGGTPTVTPGLIDASRAVYAPTLVGKNAVTPGLIDGSSAIYAPTLAAKYLLSLGLIDAGPALYAPSLGLVAYPISIGLIDGSSAIYAPTLAAKYLLSPALIDASSAIYAPTLLGKNLLSLGLIDGAPALYAPTLLGENLLDLGLLDASSDIYAPALSQVGVTPTISPDLIDAGSAIYALTVILDQFVTLALIDGAPALYAPTLLGKNLLSLGLLDAVPAVYAPTLVGKNLVSIGLIDGASAIYAPTFIRAPYPITLGLIDGASAIYAPTLALIGGVFFMVFDLIDAGPAIYVPVVEYLSLEVLQRDRISLGVVKKAIWGRGARGAQRDHRLL